jgi:hypothetical protein
MEYAFIAKQAKQTNAPHYDRGLSLSEADMGTVFNHTKTIRDFLQKEIPELFT